MWSENFDDWRQAFIARTPFTFYTVYRDRIDCDPDSDWGPWIWSWEDDNERREPLTNECKDPRHGKLECAKHWIDQLSGALQLVDN